MNNNSSQKYSGIIKAIGPGILFAGAAIGGSHLIQSTRAGANFGTELIWAVILINLFKYPFFEYGHRYTAATGKSLIDGYRQLGKWAVVTFFALTFCTAIINFSAITIVTSALTAYFFGLSLSPFYISVILLGVTLTILFVGRYPLLDKLMKVMIVVLSITTITAFFMAVGHGPSAQPGFEAKELWNAAGIAFLLALMGWMPTPIEASVFTSLWSVERIKQTQYRPKLKEALVDFHIGYIGSAIMALLFVGLGALTMYGTGEQFSDSGIEFSKQLVGLYTKALGGWSHLLMSAVALITIFSSLLTVVDAYPRILEGSLLEIVPGLKKYEKKIYWGWGIFLSLAALFIIGVFAKGMKSLLDFAAIISFLAAPVFAIINFKVVTSSFMEKEYQPKPWLRGLSWMGIIFLIGFSILFIVSRFMY